MCALALVIGGGISAGVPTAPASAAPAASVPEILPPPQEITADGSEVDLSGDVAVVAGADTDEAAVSQVHEVVDAAGGSPSDTTSLSSGVNIVVGTVEDNPQIADALSTLDVEDASDLDDEGYVAATGDDLVVLNGVDDTGTYYAAQTLRQAVDGATVPAMTVRDWPLMSIRGAIEGFYGIPWSHQARLDQLAFAGSHKMNTYIYTPKDDDYLRAKWREPYPEKELNSLAELVDQANAHHVNFTYALSPGNDVCYSSDDDFAATTAKFDQLRELGVSSFYVALDDIPLELHCDQDKERFTADGWAWLADAQTHYLDRIVDEYIEPNGLQPLQTVPTNYNGSDPDPYKKEFGEKLDDSVRVQWTGEGVFSDTITEDSVTRATQSYATDHLYIWDNFPVNDGQRGRLFLNPLEGRDPDLHTHIDGFTSNPMIEPYASMIALAGYADYTWNGPDYDAATTQQSIIDELAGPDEATRSALETFVDLNQDWKPYRPDSETAPALSADVEAFWSAYEDGEVDDDSALIERLRQIEDLETSLSDMAEPGFVDDVRPWLEAASHWASSLLDQIAMLRAIADDDGEAATTHVLDAYDERDAALEPRVDDLGSDGGVTEDAIVPGVGDGVFEDFTATSLDAYDSWLDAEPVGSNAPIDATASTSMDAYSGEPSDIADDDPDTLYWTDAAPEPGDSFDLDLGEVTSVGSVAFHQSDSDTSTGDMIYNARLEYSADGEEWTDAGTFDSEPVIEKTFDEPVDARYLRVVAADSNPGGQWVKVRDFLAYPPQTGIESDLDGTDGSGVAQAFDATVATAFHAASAPAEGSHVTRRFDEPQHLGSITLVGDVAGTLQAKTGSGWETIGELDPERVFQEADVDIDDAEAVRIRLDGSEPPSLYEFIARDSGPIAAGPFIGDQDAGETPGDGADSDDDGADHDGSHHDGSGNGAGSGSDGAGSDSDAASSDAAASDRTSTGHDTADDRSGELPWTGAPSPWVPAAAALGVIALGTVLLFRRRRS